MEKVKRQRNYAGYWENPDGEMELRVPNAPPSEGVVNKIKRSFSERMEKVKEVAKGKKPQKCKGSGRGKWNLQMRFTLNFLDS